MHGITKTVNVPVPRREAFDKFVNEIKVWWPQEYTWSGSKLVEMRITPGHGGLCTEIGPHHVRYDWGRVTTFEEHKVISFTWQISPQRIPEPDPDKASEITVSFSELNQQETKVKLVHEHFEKHGDEAEDYQKAMDSEAGWTHILSLSLIHI